MIRSADLSASNAWDHSSRVIRFRKYADLTAAGGTMNGSPPRQHPAALGLVLGHRRPEPAWNEPALQGGAGVIVRAPEPGQRAVQLQQPKGAGLHSPRRQRRRSRQGRQPIEDVGTIGPPPGLPGVQKRPVHRAFDEIVVVQGQHGGAPDMQDAEQVIQPSRRIGTERLGLCVGEHRPDRLADPQEQGPVPADSPRRLGAADRQRAGTATSRSSRRGKVDVAPAAARRAEHARQRARLVHRSAGRRP